MTGWQIPVAITVVLYGVGTFLLSNANPVHGAKMSVFLQWSGYAFLLVILRFGKDDFSLVTKTSLMYGVGAAFCFVIGTYFFFYALGVVGPSHAAVVDALSASYFIVTAILVQAFVRPQTYQEWFGMGVIAVGVFMLTLAPAPSDTNETPSSDKGVVEQQATQ